MKPLLTLFIFTILLIPAFIYAQGIVPCDGPDCQTCHVIELGQNLLTWFISVMAAVIALVFAIGGLKMVMAGGNEQKITDARGMMTNALIGFVILLAAWLMVDTIMKTFLKDDFLLGPWNEIECVAPVERVDVEDALVSSENWDTTPAPTPPGIMNLEMLPFWPELKHTRQYYGDRDVDNYFAAGTSLVIKLPDYIDQNRGLVILTFTDNKYATVGELSTSRDSGGEVLARLEYGFDNYSLGYTITPADAGKVIYFNYRPSFPPSEIPWLAQIHMSFYPTRD